MESVAGRSALRCELPTHEEAREPAPRLAAASSCYTRKQASVKYPLPSTAFPPSSIPSHLPSSSNKNAPESPLAENRSKSSELSCRTQGPELIRVVFKGFRCIILVKTYADFYPVVDAARNLRRLPVLVCFECSCVKAHVAVNLVECDVALRERLQIFCIFNSIADLWG